MKKTLLLTITAIITSWSAMALQLLPDKDWQYYEGSVTYNSGHVINIHMAGSGDKQYDRLHISGTLTPDKATLNVFPCYTALPGDRFEIFRAQAIDGSFSNPPLIDAGGSFFVLSYEEDGAEAVVVLTAVSRLFGFNISTAGSETVGSDYTYTLEIVTEPHDRGTLSASQTTFSVCDVIDVEVVPIEITSPAFIFTHWSQEGGAAIENTASKTTSARMPARAVKLIANFEELDPVPLTITGTFTAENKIYDGTVTAPIATNNLQLIGFSGLRGDQVTLTDIVLNFDNADIGTNKPVSIASATLSGIHAGNYTLDLSGAPTTIANITAKELTIGGSFTANNKTYDGTTAATGDIDNLELVGVVGNDDVTIGVVTLTFADENVGTHSVTITAANITGAQADNYTLLLADAPTASASIHPGPPAKFLITETDGGSITSPKLQNIPFNVKMTLADYFDNPTFNNDGTVTVTLAGSGGETPGSLSFQGAVGDPVEQVLGVGQSELTFSNIIYSGVSTDHGFDVQLSANATGAGSGGGISGESNLFSVRGIAFTIQADPTAIIADGTSTSTVTITLLDNEGEPLSGQDISVSTNYGTLFEGGTEIVGTANLKTAADGTVSLHLRSVTTSGIATVLAECPGACPANTTVNFIAGPAAKLFLDTQPLGGLDGQLLQTQPIVSILDANDNLATNATNTVSVSVISGVSGTLSGTIPINAVDGVGTFTDLTLAGTVGENYVFSFTADGLTPVNSDSVVLVCQNPSDGGIIGSAQTICTGTAPEILQESAAPGGVFSGILQYQWQSSSTSAEAGFTDIAYATSADYQPGGVAQTTWFRRLTRVTCETAWLKSNVIEITVDPVTVAGSISGSEAITYGSSTGDLTLSVYTGTILKWQKRPGTSGAWTDITHTNNIYSETPSAFGVWQYRAVVKSGVCIAAETEPHTLDYQPKELLIGGSFTANNKTYDGNTNATINDNNLVLSGIVGSEDVSLTDVQISFNDAQIGNNKPVSITTASLTGTQAGNYTLSLAGAPTTAANITAFVCGTSTVTDIDGNTYNTVLIGTQCWMKENLKTTTYRNGTPIEYPGDNNTAWQFNSNGAYALYNNFFSEFGKLYNWLAVTSPNGLCPTGWHVPSHHEFNTLINYLGGGSVAGGKMKSTHWMWIDNVGATDESGWSGHPGGLRTHTGDFGVLHYGGHWWSTSDGGNIGVEGNFLNLQNNHVSVFHPLSFHANYGLSVRCIRD